MNTRWNRRRFASRRLAAGAALGAALLAQSCAKPPPPAPTARVYSFDLTGGAKSCNVPKSVTLAPKKDTDVKMVVGNNGGWCAISVSVAGKPYDAGLVTTAPAHGSVYVHTVGDATRIDYTPDARYSGTDAFTVQLLPGSPSVHATVTVNPT